MYGFECFLYEMEYRFFPAKLFENYDKQIFKT